jgi:thymidylate kinase
MRAGASPDAGAPTGAASSATLALIERLSSDLDDASISWCHWKSNEALARSAGGENDLDLLVRRRDAQRFAEILRRLGFKEAGVAPTKKLPGVFHAYGLDAPSGRLVHVHAHYQLILGDDMTKGYRLPVEEPYLDSMERRGAFWVPSAEWELAIFVVRMMLKHASWDAMATLQGALSASERRELADLTDRADPLEVRRLVDRYLPYVGSQLFERCLLCLYPGAAPASRARVAAHLQRSLAACSRRSRPADTWLKLWRRGLTGFRRYVLRRRSPKRLDSGGALIAIVGGDGAGKSSAARELAAWLSGAFTTHVFHLGKPPRSMMTVAIKGPIAAARRLGAFTATAVPAHAPPAADGAFPGYAWMLWHVLSARDRYHEYVRARRLATNGALVVCDRYPMPQLRYMEGPRTEEVASAPSVPGLARLLARLEQRYYRCIAEPEIAVVLRLDPELAVGRRPEQDPAFVRRRNDEVWRADWDEADVCVVDAAQPADRVLAEIKALVWARL